MAGGIVTEKLTKHGMVVMVFWLVGVIMGE